MFFQPINSANAREVAHEKSLGSNFWKCNRISDVSDAFRARAVRPYLIIRFSQKTEFKIILTCSFLFFGSGVLEEV